jgi:hypothetical protein
MTLDILLSQRRSALVKLWFDEVVRTYPADTSQFLKQQKDPFANPVGKTTVNGLDALFNILTTGMDKEVINSFLDPIIRIRALQGFTPSQAVSFILSLKQIIKKNLEKELKDIRMMDAFIAFEARIDDLCLIAFDIYVGCREKMYQIQANEMRNTTFRAFQRAGLVKEVPEEESTGLRLVTPPTNGCHK